MFESSGVLYLRSSPDLINKSSYLIFTSNKGLEPTARWAPVIIEEMQWRHSVSEQSYLAI